MSERSHTVKRELFAWRHSRKIQLSAIGLLAGVVIIRLSLMTYWSWSDIEYAYSGWRLLLAWCLGLLALALLGRFAWQIHRGRHQTGKVSGSVRPEE